MTRRRIGADVIHDAQGLLAFVELEQKIGDTFSVRKPAPGHLTGVIEMAGGHSDRAVMVGDSEVDFATARAANIPAIGVTFGYTARPVRELAPEFGVGAIIDNFEEFMPALAKVLPQR